MKRRLDHNMVYLSECSQYKSHEFFFRYGHSTIQNKVVHIIKTKLKTKNREKD